MLQTGQVCWKAQLLCSTVQFLQKHVLCTKDLNGRPPGAEKDGEVDRISYLLSKCQLQLHNNCCANSECKLLFVFSSSLTEPFPPPKQTNKKYISHLFSAGSFSWNPPAWHLREYSPLEVARSLQLLRPLSSSSAPLGWARFSSWWFQPLWKIFVKMGIFPKFRGENKKNWNHHLVFGLSTFSWERSWPASFELVFFIEVSTSSIEQNFAHFFADLYSTCTWCWKTSFVNPSPWIKTHDPRNLT